METPHSFEEEEEFLQSNIWRAFQEAVGRPTIALEGTGFTGWGSIHRVPLAGSYLYFPRGPVVEQSSSSDMTELFLALQKTAQKARVQWIRVEPKTEQEMTEYQNFFGSRFIRAPHDVQPKETLVMNIEDREEELSARMKSKTRYNVRLAEKKGVRAFATQEKKYQEAFLELMVQTATRKEITPHPPEHYAHFFSSLPAENVFLFVAEFQGTVLAANILVLFGETATYLHGGSSDEHREVMAPYLLQWEQIRFAKTKGVKWYDFGGVKTQEPEGSWAGITRFKQGFAPGTSPRVYPGSFDIILNPAAYALYNGLRKLKKLFV